MKLCRGCEPLLFRADLDTLEKLHAKLCAACKAKVKLRLGAQPLSKREAKLIRKYGAG